MPVNNLPPQNIEAEETILGGILLDPEAIAIVAAIIPPEAMYMPAHRDIYKAALALNEQGKPTDLMSVTSYLYDRETLDRIGGQGKLAQLIDRTVSAVNIGRYSELVLEKYNKRQLIKTGNDIVQLGYDGTVDPVAAHAKSLDLLDSVIPDSGGVKSYTTAQEMVDTEDLEAVSPGLPTGFAEMDDIGGGLQPEELVILAARPSMGKSSMSLQIARNVAEIKPVVFFSIEMSRKQLMVRLLCMEAGVNSEKVRKGITTSDEKARLEHARSFFRELPLIIYDNPEAPPTPSQMSSFLSKVRKQYGEPGLFIVDHLGEMQCETGNKMLDTERNIIGIRSVGRYQGIPPMVLSQLSRGCESRNNKRPMMSDIRESGAIEQTADVVWGLYRDEYYNPGSEFTGLAEAIGLKRRNGPIGTATLEFSLGVFRTRRGK